MERLSKAKANAYLKIPRVNDKLDPNTRTAINDNTASLKPAVLFVRKEIEVSSGTKRLVDSKTEATLGVSNLEANRLPAYQNLVFNGIALGFATNAAADKESELAYGTTLPVGLRNAVLRIVQDGNLIVEIPCSEFNADNASVKELDKYVDLGGEYLLREQKPFEWNIDFPETTAASGGAGHDYVEVRLMGIQTSEQKN